MWVVDNFVFFFFKQKTAYEMRISDWSSDVCSSDLETTLMQMTTAYAMMVNGGKRIVPTLIDRVQDRHGRTIYRHELRACEVCQVEAWQNQLPPALPDEREQVVDPATAFQMVGLLQGVVQRGTGRRIAELGLPLAGTTGTTNDTFDAWFVGFSE